LIGTSHCNPLLAIPPPLGTSEEKPNDSDNLLEKRQKKIKINEQPTHKTAHLQIAQADTRPKFAKSCFLADAPKPTNHPTSGLLTLCRQLFTITAFKNLTLQTEKRIEFKIISWLK